ncbi:hypothetical protein DBW_0639 [Desulfuromonas sp. DDH964]|uniref:glycosyltransferase family 2 protein n=1 Tax=Desulfuromonas sp. DDH964 TaxID=1823759 RepID=UPI00078D3164|nr:glycosyltransferase [Desulfuromonas sp. DDH964]AMV71030.1 hypothetical protein DBW_0639 [Desulfuromonas sp. DDH964]
MNAAPWKSYLTRRQFPGPWRLEGDPGEGFAGAVIIPALAEAASLPATLTSLAANPRQELARWLIIVVVNQRGDADPITKVENQATLARLDSADRRWDGLHLAWVDAASPGCELPPGEGVGLARKLGCDLALERLDWARRGGPLLAMLDADTLVAPNYLAALQDHFATRPEGAATVAFCHQPGENALLDAAITRYELYLRSYLLGLTLAGSPYAYPTVGSTIVCRALAYLRAGGMNRRLAGEDFYFLQQLAKTAGVAPLGTTLVEPAARLSSRVPFGTGPALEKILGGDPALTLCHPWEAFLLLRDWLTCAAGAGPETGAVELLRQAVTLAPELGDFLAATGLVSNWEKLRRNHPAQPALRRAFHGWFDALQTRRLLHRLAATGYPRATAEKVLPDLLQAAGLPPETEIGKQLALLRRLQNVRPVTASPSFFAPGDGHRGLASPCPGRKA